jgi:hypothetical protein
MVMKFLDLPDEILLKIFSNLDQKELLNVTLVSKNVKELAFDPGKELNKIFEHKLAS